MSSSQEESDDDDDPQSKKQKIDESGGEVYSDALGGLMYTEATARKILKGVVPFHGGWAGEPIVAFNPNDSALNDLYSSADFGDSLITPMIYFARRGHLKMCRYLVSRGASTTKTSHGESSSNRKHFWCPMYAAASRGRLDICKFLYANGAQSDIRRVNSAGWSPFLAALIDTRHELIRWLVLHGALCADDNSDVLDVEYLQKQGGFMNNLSSYHSCRKLLEWAKERTRNHSSLLMFLRGTLPPSDSKTGHSCILQNLSGYLGVRKKIAAFVQIERLTAKQLRILHQLTEVLPSVLSDLVLS